MLCLHRPSLLSNIPACAPQIELSTLHAVLTACRLTPSGSISRAHMHIECGHATGHQETPAQRQQGRGAHRPACAHPRPQLRQVKFFNLFLLKVRCCPTHKEADLHYVYARCTHADAAAGLASRTMTSASCEEFLEMGQQYRSCCCAGYHLCRHCSMRRRKGRRCA